MVVPACFTGAPWQLKLETAILYTQKEKGRNQWERTESACFLDHPDILLDEITGVEGYQGDTACGGASHHKKEGM